MYTTTDKLCSTRGLWGVTAVQSRPDLGGVLDRPNCSLEDRRLLQDNHPTLPAAVVLSVAWEWIHLLHAIKPYDG
jgi:hypothetical protein